jgi:microcystin-dependent protein
LGLAGTLRVSQIVNAISGFQVNGVALASTHLSDSANLARQSDISGVALPSGIITEYGGLTAPSGWLLCDGSAVSRTTYASLFGKLVTSKGTGTVTIASPGVWTLNGHGFVNGDVIYFSTTGALPTGISADTRYFVVAATTNTFQISSTSGGAAINTSGTQSGTHTVWQAPYALGTFSSTTFNVPDMRGRGPMGKNAGTFQIMGATGGEEAHANTIAEMATHDHGASTSAVSAGTPAGTVTVNNAGILTTGTESADHTHSGSTGGRSAAHTHTYTQPVYGNIANGSTAIGSTGSVTGSTSTESSDHTHSFSTGGRSAAHTHDLAAHGHTASFAGTALGTHTHAITSQGGGAAHNNLQPYTVVNYIIKT